MKKFHTKDFLGKFSITIYSVIALAMLGLLSSCQSEDDLSSSKARSTFLEFNITMPLASVTAGTGYENGTKEENTISNYRVYIYGTDNKYIMSLDDASLSIQDTELNTIYTITAEITDEEGNNQLESYNNFKIVILANWETYTEPQEGSTIEELCEATSAQYSAFATNDFNLSSKHIPFYGVHEYTGVTFPEVGTEYLKESLTLLRAMAKVEIVIDCEDDNDDNITLASATLHNYNSKGYCAPASVFSQSDYGQAKDWANDYTGTSIHLVGGENDGVENEISLYKVQDKVRDESGTVIQKETWIAYVPEYDNQNSDFSYIDIKFDHQLDDYVSQDYKIYFAVYDEDGTTKAYDENATDEEKALRRDIHRNNLYRFNVSLGQYGLIVNVQDWENVFDNEWAFGEYSRLVYSDSDPSNFTDENGYIYASLVVEGNEDDKKNPTVYLQKVDDSSITSTGYVSIPETVTYLGYTYTVVQIGSFCFEADSNVIFITIPKTITYIDTDAFHNDLNLEGIAILCETPPECADDAFDGDDLESIILYVPENSVETYKSTSPWSGFTNIEGRDFDN